MKSITIYNNYYWCLISFLVPLIFTRSHARLVVNNNNRNNYNMRQSTMIGFSFIRQSQPPVEAYMTTCQRLQWWGYPCETHKVTTEDGYVLTMHRIPYGKLCNESAYQSNGGNRRHPVLVQHGILSSSADWVSLLPEENIVCNLADSCLDVWMGNYRGNLYSLEHLSMSTHNSRFWDFSFHQMGQYDIKSFIDYILEKTGSAKLTYIGHSMGCTGFFIAMTLHPELNLKVDRMFAMAPAIYLCHAKTPLWTLAHLVPRPLVMILLQIINGGHVAVAQLNQFIRRYGPSLCSGGSSHLLCYSILCYMDGCNYKELSERTMSILLGQGISDTSSKTVSHFQQFMTNGCSPFASFDNGWLKNFFTYGSFHPPIYDLSQVTVPVSIFYGKNDGLVAPEGVKRTARELGNCDKVEAVEDPEFAHLDFMFGKFAKNLVYDEIMKHLQAFSN